MQEVTRLLDINWKVLTTFHSQTNCQTEQVNQDIQRYLWMFTVDKGLHWIKWLFVAEFNYNITPYSSTNNSPFVITCMYTPQTLITSQREGLTVEVTTSCMGTLEQW